MGRAGRELSSRDSLQELEHSFSPHPLAAFAALLVVPMRSCPQCSTPCDEAHRFCPSCGFPIGKVVPNPDDPLIGKTLPGAFLILELIGIGGMGAVAPARQT